MKYSEYKLWVPGTAIPWGVTGRPSTGKKTRIKEWKRKIQDYALYAKVAEWPDDIDLPTDKEFMVSLWFVISKERKVRLPDLDNMCKAVIDALEGILWLNDNQIVEITARRSISIDEDDTPGVTLGSRILD